MDVYNFIHEAVFIYSRQLLYFINGIEVFHQLFSERVFNCECLINLFVFLVVGKPVIKASKKDIYFTLFVCEYFAWKYIMLTHFINTHIIYYTSYWIREIYDYVANIIRRYFHNYKFFSSQKTRHSVSHPEEWGFFCDLKCFLSCSESRACYLATS